MSESIALIHSKRLYNIKRGAVTGIPEAGTLREKVFRMLYDFAGFTSVSCLYTPPIRLANGLNGFNQRNSSLSFLLL